jgi:hypothetical protein
MFGVLDEKHGVGDVVFLTKSLQKAPCQSGCRGRKQPYVQESVYLWIDSGVQPKLLTVDSDHRFVERNVIRTRSVGWL